VDIGVIRANAAQTKAAQSEETFFITEKRIIYLNKNSNLKNGE
jgi:hypothetical protein